MKNNTFSLYTQLTTEELFKNFNTNEHGLNTTQIKQQYKQYGPNQLQDSTITWITLVKNQFSNPFIYLLFFVAGIYLFTNQITETIIILLIIIVNSTIGFYQEYH